MKVVWAGHSRHQPTEYGKITQELVPRLNEFSDHEFVQFAVQGMEHSRPTRINGVPTFCPSHQEAPFGVQDYKVVNAEVDADIWVLNFDAWEIGQALDGMDLPYVLYPSIEHDPIAANWMKPVNNAYEVVPYCEFGKRVIAEGLDDESGKVRHPIYCGVDTDTFVPQDRVKREVFGVGEDVFVVGMFKYAQSNGWAPIEQLAGLKLFLQEYDLWDDVVVFIYCSRHRSDTFNIETIIERLELDGVTSLAYSEGMRWGLSDQYLATHYTGCDVLLNCTKGEGIGLPILQAFAAGTPVIGNAYSVMPEFFSGEEGAIQWPNASVAGGLPTTKEDLMKVEGVGEDIAERIFDHLGTSPGPGQISADNVIATDRGWLVPVWSREATLEKHSLWRTNRIEHIAAALAAAYERPDARAKKGVAARQWVEQYSWDAVTDQWIDYIDALEDRIFKEEEEIEIAWNDVGTHVREVGGLNPSRR